MSSDENLARRLGEDFDMRLWAHGDSDASENRYTTLAEEVQLPLEGLTEAEIARIVTVFERAVAAACTVERTIVPGARVTHTMLRDDPESEAVASRSDVTASESPNQQETAQRSSIRPIRIVGDPVLRTPCDPVRTITDGTRRLVQDLWTPWMTRAGPAWRRTRSA